MSEFLFWTWVLCGTPIVLATLKLGGEQLGSLLKSIATSKVAVTPCGRGLVHRSMSRTVPAQLAR